MQSDVNGWYGSRAVMLTASREGHVRAEWEMAMATMQATYALILCFRVAVCFRCVPGWAVRLRGILMEKMPEAPYLSLVPFFQGYYAVVVALETNRGRLGWAQTVHEDLLLLLPVRDGRLSHARVRIPGTHIKARPSNPLHGVFSV